MVNPKEVAGWRAADMVQDGMRVGLGTGSTVWFALLRLGERMRDDGLRLQGVPTSLDTQAKARELGIPLLSLDQVGQLDLAIDGADEVDPCFRMIKGGGGALLREKVVASISRRVVIVVGRDKLSPRLGTAFRLPVEVVPFAVPVVERRLIALGARPERRATEAGTTYRTDNGNEILDCRFEGGIADPESLEARLHAIPGVVETGLFLNLCHALVIGADDGTCEVREAGDQNKA